MTEKENTEGPRAGSPKRPGNKPSLPQGTRDFGPDVVRKRQYILNTIRFVFELYGFQPLETPAMENLETLMGKYGEEGDKLIFRILNNGLDNPAKEQQVRHEFEKVLGGKNSTSITERALKYDLTIPFARYVAMNHNQLGLPFKRYQIQPVWRADRPQKGRYREFYQCDADVVGSNSLINELELANIYNDVFQKLGIKNYELRINSRKILTALAEISAGAEKMMDITIAIDKLDKIGVEKVMEELAARGLNNDQIAIIESYLNINGNNEEKLSAIKKLFGDSSTAKQGIEQIEFLVAQTTNYKQHTTNLTIDFTLARGLNYYTGIIFEAKAPQEVKMGSIGGGGRYDDLTGLFGVPNIPGVGISFGVDRIYDVMEELKLFPETIDIGTKVLFFNLGAEEGTTAYYFLQQIRQKGIASEIYHEPTKLDKQFKYAEKKNIPFAVIIGSKEIETKTCVIKDLRSGEQCSIAIEALTEFSFV
jgi:histidyl-tRNA synthetase